MKQINKTEAWSRFELLGPLRVNDVLKFNFALLRFPPSFTQHSIIFLDKMVPPHRVQRVVPNVTTKLCPSDPLPECTNRARWRATNEPEILKRCLAKMSICSTSLSGIYLPSTTNVISHFYNSQNK